MLVINRKMYAIPHNRNPRAIQAVGYESTNGGKKFKGSLIRVGSTYHVRCHGWPNHTDNNVLGATAHKFSTSHLLGMNCARLLNLSTEHLTERNACPEIPKPYCFLIATVCRYLHIWVTSWRWFWPGSTSNLRNESIRSRMTKHSKGKRQRNHLLWVQQPFLVSIRWTIKPTLEGTEKVWGLINLAITKKIGFGGHGSYKVTCLPPKLTHSSLVICLSRVLRPEMFLAHVFVPCRSFSAMYRSAAALCASSESHNERQRNKSNEFSFKGKREQCVHPCCEGLQCDRAGQWLGSYGPCPGPVCAFWSMHLQQR